jgi:hypothetical protein
VTTHSIVLCDHAIAIAIAIAIVPPMAGLCHGGTMRQEDRTDLSWIYHRQKGAES